MRVETSPGLVGRYVTCELGGRGGGVKLAPWMARARCKVREPWPVPDSRISRGGVSVPSAGGAMWMSRRETMRLASAE